MCHACMVLVFYGSVQNAIVIVTQKPATVQEPESLSIDAMTCGTTDSRVS